MANESKAAAPDSLGVARRVLQSQGKAIAILDGLPADLLASLAECAPGGLVGPDTGSRLDAWFVDYLDSMKASDGGGE